VDVAAYQPRDTEGVVVHRIVRENLETFLREATGCADGGGLPRFVEREARRDSARTTPGTWFLIAVADGAGGVTEPFEANNTRSRAIDVVP